MQIIKCHREKLLKPLQIVGGIVEGRQTLPILAHILIRKNGEDVEFTTTDLEIQVNTKAAIGIGDSEVQTTLPASKLISILTALPGSDTEIGLKLDAKKAELATKSSTYRLVHMEAKDYPALPAFNATTSFVLPSSVFKHLLQMVYFAMAQQDARYYLNGVLLTSDGSVVRCVATDGHRLACCDANTDLEFEDKLSAILPRKSVLQLIKLLPDNDTELSIDIGETQARFAFDNVELRTKLIESKYPDYERVIPQNNDKTFTVNREELIGALKRAAILTNDKVKGLRWIITPGNLQVRSTNAEEEEACEEVSIDYNDEELDLGFNVAYLVDVISNLKNATVRFSFSSAQGATLVSMPETDDFKYVLMPMRI